MQAWLDAGKHRSAGNLRIRDPVMSRTGRALSGCVPELQERLRERFGKCQHFDMSTPQDACSPRSGHCSDSGGSPPTPRSQAGADASKPRRRAAHASSGELPTRLSTFVLGSKTGLFTAVAGLAAAVALLLAVWQQNAARPLVGLDTGILDVKDAALAFDELHGRKLQNIAASVSSLSSLAEVVAKAETTYEEVYHNRLVQHSFEAREPDEISWNSFVLEARGTGPVFLDGKEQLRDAAANLHRLIRRAPEFLKSLVHYLRLKDADEAAWYLDKVIKLVSAVHQSIEGAALKFASVDASVSGMTRDARENEEHLGNKAVRLEDEAKAIEGGPMLYRGSWSRLEDQAMSGCYLDKFDTSLEDCKGKCVEHSSGACTHVTYYKTTMFSKCYLHCASATAGKYRDADSYVLEKAPEELAVDIQKKRQAGQLAVELHNRWRTVQTPLQDVSRLVRRFRSATADLRKSLEEVRYAAGDLKAAFVGQTAQNHQQQRLLERRIGDVVLAIEDLGHSLSSWSQPEANRQEQ
eukprot:TRINITY_DN56574_c0_g1_i1.p1 TRINITY_DN56574_c0_g1~~TRINITY_DN56574_c0_g1_i1.p1  ORF type:complete len:523 (+),score=137.62 TRINITY_DN56574_c0_g1_i1:105-1673(+)